MAYAEPFDNGSTQPQQCEHDYDAGDRCPKCDLPLLPSGCGYQGYEFGASYMDSMCYGGKLYNCDDCDGDGNLYEPTEDIPCPVCHPTRAARYWAEQLRYGGCEMSKADSMKRAWKSVRASRKRHKESIA